MISKHGEGTKIRMKLLENENFIYTHNQTKAPCKLKIQKEMIMLYPLVFQIIYYKLDHDDTNLQSTYKRIASSQQCGIQN